MKKLTVILALFAGTGAALSAQSDMHTMYFDALMNISAEHHSAYQLKLIKVNDTRFKGTLYDFSNSVKAEGNYIYNGSKYLEDGAFTYYYPSGQVESEGHFVRGVKVGVWKRYDMTGQKKTDRYYPEESADKVREAMGLEKNDDER